MRWANKRGRDSQCGKHPGTARAKASSTAALLPHHWPGHTHGPTPIGLHKPAIHTHTHTMSVFLCKKARIIIHLKCQSHCSVNYLHNGKKGVAGQTVNQCQDAYDYASFTFSLLLHPFLCRVPSALSTLPTASLNTHLQTSPHSYQGDGNVTLNCCHFLLLEYHWAGHKEELSVYARDGSISWIFWVLIVIQNNNMGHSHRGILRSRE